MFTPIVVLRLRAGIGKLADPPVDNYGSGSGSAPMPSVGNQAMLGPDKEATVQRERA